MSWRVLLIACALVGLLPLAGCLEDEGGDGGDGGTGGDAAVVETRTLEKGQQSGFHEGATRVFTDADAWEAFWREHDPQGGDAPTVDFGSEDVLAIVLGDRPNACYAVNVTRVLDDPESGRRVVRAEEHTPPPDAFCAEVVTQPFHFVAAPTSEYPVTWDVHEVEPASEQNAKEGNVEDSNETARAPEGRDPPGEEPDAPAQAGPVEWALVDRGPQSGVRANKTVVVTTDAEWRDLWAQHTSYQTPPEERPDVNFTTHRVVAVFMGERPSSGYAVNVTGVHRAEAGGPVIVNVTWVEHSGAALTVMTYPFAMITIPAGDADVELAERARTVR